MKRVRGTHAGIYWHKGSRLVDAGNGYDATMHVGDRRIVRELLIAASRHAATNSNVSCLPMTEGEYWMAHDIPKIIK